MPENSDAPGRELERFREYLRLLARRHFTAALRGQQDPSDLVQQVLLEAHHKGAHLQAGSDAELAAWLRQNLAWRLADAAMKGARERSLQELDASSAQLGASLAARQPSPSQQAALHELAVRVAEVLQHLPESQREAVVLRFWEGCSIEEIGRRLGKTDTAVGGLLKRGLHKLRELLQERE